MNITLFYFLHSFAFQSPWLDSLIWFVAEPLIYIMIVIAALYIIVYYRLSDIQNISTTIREKWKSIIAIPVSAGLAWLLANLLKVLIHTTRPYLTLPDVHSLFIENGYAFPSGHSTAMAALAFAIYFKNRPLGIVFMVAALLIGVSRVMAGVHFPIDIIGGYALGFGVAYLLRKSK